MVKERETLDNEKAKEFVEVLHEKSYRLKQLIEDLIEASKASSGNLTVTKEKINKIEKVYTRDLALIEASRIAREKLEQKLGDDIEILYEKSLKITEENSKIDIEIFFTLKEDITAYQEIPEVVEEES